MASIPTADDGYDISFLPVPETTLTWIPIAQKGSVAASARLWVYFPQRAHEAVRLAVAPTTISSGTLKVDVLVNGVTILATKATATVADTPVAATFTTTRIPAGCVLTIATTSDSSTVTDVFGAFIMRPLLGAERHV